MPLLPRVLIIDDLFGRLPLRGRNEDRAHLCGQFLIRDVTPDGDGITSGPVIKRPVAEAVFCRGQTPARSTVGDIVENDLPGTIDVVRAGWECQADGILPWTMVLLDLCFYTGAVTEDSDQKTPGMPKGRPGDDEPGSYFGLTLLRAIHEEFPQLPVVILSSKSRDDVSAEFVKHGALGFLARGEVRSRQTLQEYIQRHGLITDDSGEIVGRSVALLLALRAARRAAGARQHLMIRGERGTGKELLARYIHRHGAAHTPFVTVDCGALSPELYGSELFGHLRGAFTGADRDRQGRVLEAHGGELFLDEVGNMPLVVQTGLLRVVQEREVVPIGGKNGQEVDVRILSATNEQIENGDETANTFRRDLLDRLCEGGTVVVPPLRDRRGDIAGLADGFVREAEQAFGAMPRQIDPAAISQLQDFDWPGNIRQLRSVIFEAVGQHRDVEHLSPGHLSLPATIDHSQSMVRGRESGAAVASTPPGRLADLIGVLESFDVESASPGELVGVLRKLDRSYGRLLARVARRALTDHMRPTLDEPDGKLLIHPAVVMLSGDRGLTASKAYDVVIRLRQLVPEADELWQQDPVLREAYRRAYSKRRGVPDEESAQKSNHPKASGQ